MNEEYLKGLHNHLGIKDDYDTWINSVKDNEDYLKGLHNHLGIKDDYDTWNTSVLGKKKDFTDSQSTGSQESTPSDSQSKETKSPAYIPVPGTLKESMEQFNETEEIKQPVVGTKAAEKPKEKSTGSSEVIEFIMTEESAKARTAQDALLEHQTSLDSGIIPEENQRFSETEAIKKAEEAMGADFSGKSYQEVKGIVDGSKQYAEQVLFENTLEKAKEEEVKDETVFGLTRTAFWDGLIETPARTFAIRQAAARGDYATVENMQQEINLRAARTSLSLGIDPTDSRGITETWQDGNIGDAIYKGLNGAAGSAGGLMLTIAAPNLGIAYFGTTAYASTYNEYVDRGDLTWEEKESLALIAGATEIVVGKFLGGLGNVKRFRGALGISDDIGKAGLKSQRAAYDKALNFLEPYGKNFTAAMRKPAVRGAGRAAYDTVSEAFEEGFVDIVNQVAAHGIAGDDFDAYSIYDSMILGAAMGGPMGVGTGVAQYRAINSVYNKPLSKDLEKYEDLQAQYKDLKTAAKEETDPSKRAIIKEAAEDVRKEIKEITKRSKEAYNKLTDKEAIELHGTNKEISKLSQLARDPDTKSGTKRAIQGKLAGLLLRKGELESKAGIESEVDKTIEPTGATEASAVDSPLQGESFTDIVNKQTKEREAAEKRLSPNAVAANKSGTFTYESDGNAAPKGTEMVPALGNTKSIKKDKKGNIKRVVMKSPDGGTTYNLTGQDAKDMAEQLYLNDTPNRVLGKRFKYLNKANNTYVEGVVMKDGQTLVVETDDGNIIEIGNINELANTPLRDLGLSEGSSEKSTVESELEKDKKAKRVADSANKAEAAADAVKKSNEASKEETTDTKKVDKSTPDVSAIGMKLDEKSKSSLDKIRKVLGFVVPNLKIVVHSSRDSYNETYEGAKRSNGHFNPNTKTIHILSDGKSILGKDLQTLIRHEAIHPVLDALLQHSPEATARAAAGVRSILARMSGNANARRVIAHSKKYSGQGQEIEDLELVTEFFAVFSDASAIEEAKKSVPSFLERVGDMLSKLLRAVNIIDSKTKLEGEKEIKDLLNSFEFSFSTGKTLNDSRHKNILDSKKKQIRESIDNIGKEPYAPKRGESLQNLLEGLDKSKSNFIKAIDFEHSLELRRLGFFESHQLSDGSILLGKGARYETYDAYHNVAKIHPKSFISKTEIKGDEKQKVANTISALAKFLKSEVEFIDRPDLPFTSTLIIPDPDNKLKSPTPVVNLAYANTRTGSSGFSTFIVEAIRTASPVTLNEVLKEMKTSNPKLNSVYQKYLNTYTGLDITSNMSKEDIEFLAFSRLLQESIDRVTTKALDSDYSEFASDMQEIFSSVITEEGNQDSAKNKKGEYKIQLMPFGENFIPALKNIFIDKKIEFQESLSRGKETAKKLIDNLAKIVNDSRDSGTISRQKDELSLLHTRDVDRLNVIDWIAMETEGDFSHPAIKRILKGYGIPSILNVYADEAQKLGAFYVHLNTFFEINKEGGSKSYAKVEKAFFDKSDSGLSESEKAVLKLIQSYADSMSESLRILNFNYEAKQLSTYTKTFISDVAGGLEFDAVAKSLGIEEGVVATSRSNSDAVELLISLGTNALSVSEADFADEFSEFLGENVYEQASDAYLALYKEIKTVDSEIALKTKEFSSPKQALDFAINELNYRAVDGAFVKTIKYSEIIDIIKNRNMYPDGLPEGSESTIFSRGAELEIAVTPTAVDGIVDVSYGFRYKGKNNRLSLEYADYPNKWAVGKITLPLVFDAVAEISGLINAKGVVFQAIANSKSNNIDESLYDEKQLEEFKGNIDNRAKRRGLNNITAFKQGSIIDARTSGNISFFFKDSKDNNILYTTKDKKVTSLISNLTEFSDYDNADGYGQAIADNSEIYKAIISGDIKTTKEVFSKEGDYLSKMLLKGDMNNENSYVVAEAETIKNTGVLSSTFENSIKYIAPAVIRESLSDEGPSGEESAMGIDNMFAQAEKHIIEAASSKKWDWKKMLTRKTWVDRNANLKKAMADGFSKYIMALQINKAGATSYADRRFQDIRKSIYDNITNTERELIDKYIFMKRVVDIDTTWIKRRNFYDSKLREEQSQIAYYQSELSEAKKKGDKALVKEIEDDIKESKDKSKYFESQFEKYSVMPLHPQGEYVSKDGKTKFLVTNKESAERAIEHFKDTLPAKTMTLLEERAESYFDAYKEILRDHYKAGLIDKETMERFINNDYSPRLFLQKMFGNIDEIVLQQNGNFAREQIQAIRSGSDNGIFTDTEYLLDISLRALENKKAKNKLFQEMHKEAKLKSFEIAGGQFIREGNFKRTKAGEIKQDAYGNYEYENADENFVNVFYREGGKVRAFQIHKDYHSDLVGIRGYAMSPKTRKVLKWITGTQIVKATATALNPFFAITGTLRGFKEVTRGRGVYDKYKYLPIMNVMVLIDFVKAAKDVTTSNNELVEEYYAHGGGMSFMTTQGKPDKLYQKKRKFGIEFLQRRGIKVNPFGALAYAGEKAELALRLAVYKRTKENLENSMPDATEDQIKTMAAAEARLIADFAQGGELSTELDVLIPYFNAAIQGTRASYDYMKQNPKKFWNKQIQAYALNTALAVFARMTLWDDEEDEDAYAKTSPWILEKYNLIPTGLKNSLGEHITLKIPKVHQFLMFDAVAEITAKEIVYALKGKEFGSSQLSPDGDGQFLMDAILSSFPGGQFVPISDMMRGRNPISAIGQRLIGSVPTASSLIAYAGNYDLFRDKIISYDKGEVFPFAEGYKDANTHDIYKFFGDITSGMKRGSISPKRAEVAIEKLIGSESTLLTALLYQMTDRFITTKEERRGIELPKPNKEYKNMFGLGKSFMYTIPSKAYQKKEDIAELINMESLTEAKMIKKDIRIAAGKYTLDELRVMGESGKLPEELTNFVSDLDQPQIMKKYYLSVFKNLAMGNAVDDNKYLQIKYAKTPEAELKLFMHYFGDPAELSGKELSEIQGNLQLIGYSFSDMTKSYYPREKKNNKK